jgi:hypothetical protein
VNWIYQTRPIPDEIEALLRDVSVDPQDPTAVPRLQELTHRQVFTNIQLREVAVPAHLQRYHDIVIQAADRFDADTTSLRDGPLPPTTFAAVQQLRAAQRLLTYYVIGCYTKLDSCASEEARR